MRNNKTPKSMNNTVVKNQNKEIVETYMMKGFGGLIDLIVSLDLFENSTKDKMYLENIITLYEDKIYWNSEDSIKYECRIFELLGVSKEDFLRYA